jgi:hypothetical protein
MHSIKEALRGHKQKEPRLYEKPASPDNPNPTSGQNALSPEQLREAEKHHNSDDNGPLYFGQAVTQQDGAGTDSMYKPRNDLRTEMQVIEEEHEKQRQIDEEKRKNDGHEKVGLMEKIMHPGTKGRPDSNH